MSEPATRETTDSGSFHPQPVARSVGEKRIGLKSLVWLGLIFGLIGGNWWAYHQFIAHPGRATPIASPPGMYLAEAEQELGDVALDDGEILPVVFHYENRGPSPITITEISTSCSCTDATASRTTTQPGESGEIHVQIRLSKLGPGSAAAIVYTDDPAHPKLELRCRWNGIARLLFDQTTVDFGPVLPGATAERELRLTFQDRGRFPACRVVAFDSSPEITVNPLSGTALNAPLPDESRYQVVLRATRQLGPGRGVIRCRLQDCYQDEFVIPVSWTVRSRIQATPQQLFLGSGMTGDVLKKKVIVTSTAPDQLVVQSVKINPEGVGTATLQRISETCQNIEVTLMLTAANQPLRGTLVLECLEPVNETLEIPWSAEKVPANDQK